MAGRAQALVQVNTTSALGNSAYLLASQMIMQPWLAPGQQRRHDLRKADGTEGVSET